MDKPVAERLFFALWPDAQTARAIWTAAGSLVPGGQGRRLLPEHIHLTLAFLGSIDTETYHCMSRVAAQLQGQAFELSLDTAGHFPKPQVVWVGPQRIPSALKAFQFKLVSELSRVCAYEPEPRPFLPHVTLWRKVKQVVLPETFPSIPWSVSRFVLARSRTMPGGAEYSIVASWPLSAGDETHTQS